MKYYDKENILNLNVPESVKENIKDKFNKSIYYEYQDRCKIGILIGILIVEDCIKYIITDDGFENYVSINQSITKII